MFMRRFTLSITTSLLLQPLSVVHAQATQPEASQKQIFLPIVSNNEQEATPRSPAIILTEEEVALEQLFVNEPDQRHPTLKLNATLVEQARRKAQDMGRSCLLWSYRPRWIWTKLLGTEGWVCFPRLLWHRCWCE